jgi:AcrR family transcriptional regulator
LSRRAAAAPLRERRSQAERTAETRARIIDAVIESIADVGFPRTTAAEIAGRAGVTWGAVQHHFGGKDGILEAVLEHSFSRFAALVDPADVESEALEARVSHFVDRSWEHFRSPTYQSTLQILLHYAGDVAVEEADWQSDMRASFGRVWSHFFGGEGRANGRFALQHYTISVLTGLAAMQQLGRAGTRAPQVELDWLKRTLVRELSGERAG